MLEQSVAEYTKAIYATNRILALQVVQKAFEGGVSAEDIVFKIVIPSINSMLFSVTLEGASIAQHFIASQIASDVVEQMLPHFKQKPASSGTIVIGSAFGDFHGLGKRIVIGCLKAQMYEVYDLGLNVAPDVFVDKAQEYGAQIIGISSLMVHTARGDNGCRKVRQLLNERSLESSIKILVGGAPYRFDGELYLQVGADAWADTAMDAGPVVDTIIREMSQ